MATWSSQYAFVKGQPLEFRFLEQTAAAMNPAEALAKLGDGAAVKFHDTRLSGAPFWFRFLVPAATSGEETLVEFPSRHAKEITCWDADSMALLGQGDRSSSSDRIKPAKAGFALELGSRTGLVTLLCRATFAGPARLTVLQWPGSEHDISVHDFHRELGLLEGGLTVLAAFVLLTAVINREWLYVLFAVWLVANLRLAQLSTGGDTLWLAREIPAEWMLRVRELSIAAYYVITYTLFNRLFSDDLKRIGYSALLRSAQWLGLPLLAFAATLPYATFLPVMWLIAGCGSVVLVFLLARILLLTRSPVASWYGASIGITLFSSFYEVVSAALGVKHLLWAANSVTAAVFSSLMAALAISAQMRQERLDRVKAQVELRNTYDAIPVGLFTLAADATFLGCNPALRAMLGLGAEAAVGRRWHDFFADDAWTQLQRIAAAGDEIELAGRSGSSTVAKTFHVKATLSNGRIEGSLQDVTERAKATERLHYLAEYDPLTNVLNRRGIEKVLDAAALDLAEHRPLAIAYLDLDRFKLINDLFGHTTGDEVLKQVCERIRAELEAGQHIGRVGGDEFVVVFQDTPVAAATQVCRRIIGRIEDEPCHIGEKAFQVKGSIGLVEVAESTVARDAISVADRACREAKKTLDSLVVYERNATAFREREEELHMIGRFGVGRVPDGLFLEMQPIMSLLAPHDSLNFEMLLRLREADGSITPAWKVISAAENNGRISLIDRWVLSTAIEWLATHRSRLRRTRFVCVNLSGASLNDEKFIQDAFAMLADAGRTAEMLCFEITESVALHDLGNTNRFIDTVRGFGAKVALDDFGAGYTSFSYLKELSADAVKIDGAFVRDVNAHPANLSIVEAIAELSRNLGMKSIAEWAEDVATVEALADVGVDYVQGYAVARPMAPERILAAESAADLIEDPQVAKYVREGLGHGQSHSLWERGDWLPPDTTH